MRRLRHNLIQQDLAAAVWAAEFVRQFNQTSDAHDDGSARARKSIAERAAERAYSAVEAFDLIDIEFRTATSEERDRCMLWEDFIVKCSDAEFVQHHRDSPAACFVSQGLRGELQISDLRVFPEEVHRNLGRRPSWATHVYWRPHNPHPF